MTHHHAKIAALLGTALTLSAATAQAQQSRSTAVLNVEGDALDRASAATLTAIIRNEAQQNAAFEVVNKSPVGLSEVVFLLGCDASTHECLGQAAQQINVKVLIFARLDRQGQDHRMRLEIFDADKGRVTHRTQQTLAGADVIVSFREAAEVFFGQIDQEAQAATLQISSNVRGATVKLNGAAEGVTPFERAGLKPGAYALEVSRDGFTTWSAEVELAAGATLKLSAPIKPLPPQEKTEGPTDPVVLPSPRGKDPALKTPGSPSPSERYDALPTGGLALVGIGAASLLASGVMAYQMKSIEQDLRDRYDGQISRRERDELVTRGRRYETAHRVLLGVGLASATIGAVWIVVDRTSSPEPDADARLSLDQSSHVGGRVGLQVGVAASPGQLHAQAQVRW